MGERLVFTGPGGDYTITLPDVAREDGRLLVRDPDGEAQWAIENIGIDAGGVTSLSGMTSGSNALWFELCIGEPPEIRYWGDRVILRADAGRREQMPLIREIRPDDAEALVAYVEGLVAEGPGTITLRKAPTLEQEREFIAKAEAAERAFILVAVDGERIVGMLDLQAGERDFNRHCGRFGMSVAKDWRGKGVGRAILAAAIEKTHAWPGFCRIELEVFPNNATAIALYKSMGFELEARKVKAVQMQALPEDLLLMALVW